MTELHPGLTPEEEEYLTEHGYEYTPLPIPFAAKREKEASARTLFIESVLKPDHELRQCARNQKCYDELMAIRQHVLEYLGYHEKT
jgi:hypothetical protein